MKMLIKMMTIIAMISGSGLKSVGTGLFGSVEETLQQEQGRVTLAQKICDIRYQKANQKPVADTQKNLLNVTIDLEKILKKTEYDSEDQKNETMLVILADKTRLGLYQEKIKDAMERLKNGSQKTGSATQVMLYGTLSYFVISFIGNMLKNKKIGKLQTLLGIVCGLMGSYFASNKIEQFKLAQYVKFDDTYKALVGRYVKGNLALCDNSAH